MRVHLRARLEKKRQPMRFNITKKRANLSPNFCIHRCMIGATPKREGDVVLQS